MAEGTAGERPLGGDAGGGGWGLGKATGWDSDEVEVIWEVATEEGRGQIPEMLQATYNKYCQKFLYFIYLSKGLAFDFVSFCLVLFINFTHSYTLCWKL